MRLIGGWTLLAGLAAAVGSASPLLAVELVPHRAVYDLGLESKSDRSGVNDIRGRMVYEFSGSACEGYTTTFRFVTSFDTESGQRLIDEQTTTFEAGDGGSFDFSTRSFIDRQLDRETRGRAEHDGDTTRVEVQRPERASHELPASLFPTEHLIDLIEKAQDGRQFYEAPIFDGSEAGEKVMTTTVAIGRRASVEAGDPEREAMADVPGHYWPVDIAYFEPESEGGEQVPTYRIALKLHEGGITRDLVMDYGEFAIAGQLVELTLLAQSDPCD